MSKDDADYIDEPVGDEVCANCQFYYVGTDGEAVCSKVRGQVYPEHWCRLWEPGDDLKEGSVSTDDVDKLFNKSRVYVDSPDEVPNEYEVQEGVNGGLFYEIYEPSDETDVETNNNIGTGSEDVNWKNAPDEAIEVDRVIDIPNNAVSTRNANGNLVYVNDDDVSDAIKRNENELAEEIGGEVKMTGMSDGMANFLVKTFDSNVLPNEWKDVVNNFTTAKDDLDVNTGLSDATFEPESGTLYIAPSALRTDGIEQLEEWNNDGDWAVPTAEGLIFHEIAHALHNKSMNDEDVGRFDFPMIGNGIEIMKNNSNEIREGVSSYAMENEMELVAETFSMLAVGEEPPQAAVDAMKEFLGVMPNV